MISISAYKEIKSFEMTLYFRFSSYPVLDSKKPHTYLVLATLELGIYVVIESRTLASGLFYENSGLIAMFRSNVPCSEWQAYNYL